MQSKRNLSRNATRSAIVGFLATFCFASILPLHADTFEWTVDANGEWNDDGNWLRTIGTTRVFPNSTGDVAHLLNATVTRTIAVPDLNPGGVSFAVGELHVGSSTSTQSFIIDGPGTLWACRV